MMSINNSVIAKYKKSGYTFEILLDPFKAYEFKKGKITDISEVVASKGIYKNAHTGEIMSKITLKSVFESYSHDDIIKEIILKGTFPKTALILNNEKNQKQKRIVQYIRTNAINPATGHSYEESIIEAAIKETKVKINDSNRVEDEAEKILKKLKLIIPIKTEDDELEIIIPKKFVTSSKKIIKNLTKVKRELSDEHGCVITCVVHGGLVDTLFSQLDKSAHGSALIRFIRKS